ncbi:MAG: DUF4115 domain-containing protein [Elusimicrobia bacterium]|nr:DUF4115 domain-containing protein [Elusimicrobiota bacterium]
MTKEEKIPIQTPAVPAPLAVHELLRARRTERGLTIEKVRDDTKIPTKFLNALEEARYDAFPARVYCRGFFLNYAKYLALANPPELWEKVEGTLESDRHSVPVEKRETKRRPQERIQSAPGENRVRPDGPWESFVLWALEGQNWIFAFLVLPALLVGCFYGVYSYVQRQSYHSQPRRTVDVNKIIGQTPPAGRERPALDGPGGGHSVAALFTQEFQMELATKSEPTWLRVDVDERRAFEGVLPALQKRSFRVKGVSRIRVGNPKSMEVRINGTPWPFSVDELERTPLEAEFNQSVIEAKLGTKKP